MHRTWNIAADAYLGMRFFVRTPPGSHRAQCTKIHQAFGRLVYASESIGIPHAEFELLGVAVSAINGCGMYLDSHGQVVCKAGVETMAGAA